MNRRQLLQSAALLALLWSGKALSLPRELTTTFGAWPAATPPDRIYAAGPPAAVLTYCLVPEKMLGWPYQLSRQALNMLPSEQRDLPLVGRLAGRGSTVNFERLMAMQPDVILDIGTVNATYLSTAEQVARQTGIPYILMDGNLIDSPEQLRTAGSLLGAGTRGDQLALYAETILADTATVRQHLAKTSQPSIYLARSTDGLETGLAGSIHEQAFALLGARNVALSKTSSGVGRVSMEQILAWDPDYIFTQNEAFFHHAQESAIWKQLRAVKEKRLYRVPLLPFGWLDAPPGINRLLGLQWLAHVFLDKQSHQEINLVIQDFFQTFYRTAPSADLLNTVHNANL